MPSLRFSGGEEEGRGRGRGAYSRFHLCPCVCVHCVPPFRCPLIFASICYLFFLTVMKVKERILLQKRLCRNYIRGTTIGGDEENREHIMYVWSKYWKYICIQRRA